MGGLARLVAADMLPAVLSAASARVRIEAMVGATRALQDRNGSVGEAFPHEGSFCVTALVAFDLLVAYELLADQLDERQRGEWLETIGPMVRFVSRTDETHAVITNHLATAVAALMRWSDVTGETAPKQTQRLLSRIRASQSAEGWFPEYGGADPGYQTLALNYLSDVHERHPEQGLAEPLARAVRFLTNFAHPDGSFGGLYGSRNTRFFHPEGVERLAATVPEAAALASAMRRSIATRSVVTLGVIDEPNLVPMFNGYCAAAVIAGQQTLDPRGSALPALRGDTGRVSFPQAGLVVDRGPRHYSVISTRKGGVCHHFVDRRLALVDGGAVASGPGGATYTTQADHADARVSQSGEQIEVETPMVRLDQELPGPLQFALLRLASVTVLRLGFLNRAIKRLLVRRLITAKRDGPAVNRRIVRLGEDLQIEDSWTEAGSGGLVRLPPQGAFSALHMASQGYWQRQDDEA